MCIRDRAGLVGIVVSIGVSLDSNVVFYEHLKEDVLHGQSLRLAGEKSFPAAFSTVSYTHLTLPTSDLV